MFELVVGKKTVLPADIEVTKFESTPTSAMILYNTGELYGIGTNTTQHFGNGSAAGTVYNRWVLLKTDVKDFWLGTYGTTRTTLIQKNDLTYSYAGSSIPFNNTGNSTATWANADFYFTNVNGGTETVIDIKLSATLYCITQTTDGRYKIYFCGNNGSGQYGNGTGSSPGATYTTLTNTLGGISKMSVNNASIIKYRPTATTSLYRSGNCQNYQLGTGTNQNVANDRYADISQIAGNISEFTLGSTSSYVTTLDGANQRLYCSGINSSGQLGFGDTTTRTVYTQLQATSAGADNAVLKFASNGGLTTSFCYLGNDGYLYTTGSQTGNVLGNGVTSGSKLTISRSDYNIGTDIQFLSIAGTDNIFYVKNNILHASGAGASTTINNSASAFSPVSTPY